MTFLHYGKDLHPPISKTVEPPYICLAADGKNSFDVEPKTTTPLLWKNTNIIKGNINRKHFHIPHDGLYRFHVWISWENKRSGAGSGGHRSILVQIGKNTRYLNTQQNLKSLTPFPLYGILPVTQANKSDVVQILVEQSSTVTLKILDINIAIEAL